jgi:medium-chain acyl-[acyl-carrier-protein] hydrolase
VSGPAGTAAAATAAAGLLPWVQFTEPTTAKHIPLVMFHHAGGGASAFRGWVPRLATRGVDAWPVQLPGRENRFGEPLFTELDILTERLTDLFGDQLSTRHYALFGHSAGAMVACAFAMRAAQIGLPAPVHVFVSGCRPVSHPDPDWPIHRLPDDPLVAKLRGYGGMPEAVLDSPEMMAMVLRIVRADLRLVETASWPTGRWLDCPLTAVSGIDDHSVPAEVMPHWQDVTTGPFDHRVIPGGHFPSRDGERQLVGLLGSTINGNRAT